MHTSRKDNFIAKKHALSCSGGLLGCCSQIRFGVPVLVKKERADRSGSQANSSLIGATRSSTDRT